MLRIFLFFWLLVLRAFCWANSWQQVQADHSGQLNIYWFESRPFIYPNDDEELIGIEVEIMEAFRDYLRQHHKIDLHLNWVKANSFYNIIETVESAEQPNTFGVSAFSITEERQKIVKYTSSYLPDVTVLVSSQGTPIVQSFDEISEMINGMTAITIKGTVYEKHLLELKEKLDMDFDIRYIKSDKNVLDDISRTSNSFGFVDLPIYLMWIKKGSDLVRQNFFTVYGTGYGMIMPLHSEWNIPFGHFLSDQDSKQKIAEIISRHIGPELYEFIETLYEGELLGTSILTKEKEIQLALIKSTNLRLEEERKYRHLLIVGITLCVILLTVIGVVLYNNQKFTRVVLDQKELIEEQKENIRHKNDQLLNRNTKLIAFNEEKNTLINILAHDLRSPLNQIIGMADALISSNSSRPLEENDQLGSIRNAADRMNKMVSKILSPQTQGEQNLVIREQVDVRQIVNDVAIRYRPAAARKSIEFQVKACQKHYELQTDYLLLFLILENLISNAVKFSSPGTVITLECRCSPSEVLFMVSDEGPGFTDDDKLMIFNRFQKLSARPTGDESSTGLGLSIVRKYVSDLGGRIWLESEVGQGSIFYVSFSR